MTVITDARAALFDVDGTLTTGGDVWDLLFDSPAVMRWRRLLLYPSLLPRYGLTKLGVLSQSAMRDRWVRKMASLMTGWDRGQVNDLCQSILERRLIPALRPDVVELVDAYREMDRPVVIVSTMFADITARLAAYLEMDAGLGTVLTFAGERCTGRIDGETCSGPRKLAFAQAYLRQHHHRVALSECAAYADSASDIDFIGGAGFPVAVHPDEVMRAAAIQRGWFIVEGVD